VYITKFSRAISRVKFSKETDVSGTISVSFVREVYIGAFPAIQTHHILDNVDVVPVSFENLTQVMARKDFMKLNRRESFKS
jgi:hypothetical protein